MNLILMTVMLSQATAHAACNGRFVNPITDICWSCIFPITIGGKKIVGDRRDTPNRGNPICVCMRDVGGAFKVPVPGLALGFWEPVRLIDVTRTPFCMVNMGGMELPGLDSYKKGIQSTSGHSEETAGTSTNRAFYHTHYYIYPLIYWLELLTDLGCMEAGTFDLAYMSEFDPLYSDDHLSSILNPEAAIFANPLAQAACIADCLSANTSFANDNMFWCAGCLGSLYPLSGYVEGSIGGIQASSLLATRTIAKYHRMGLALSTSTDDDSRVGGPICKKSYAPYIKKSQYKLQLTFPQAATSGEFACAPLGMTDAVYNSNKVFPGTGEDFGYLVWRKKNCCFL